jgi:type I restriction enzyme S subunit
MFFRRFPLSGAWDTSHYPKEVPFEVPKGWVWCSFPAVAELISGQDFPPEKYNSSAKGIPYIIGASNIEDGHLRISRWTEYPSVLSQKGDVLVVCKGAGVGKVAVNDIGTVHIARQIQAVRIQDEIVSSDFMRILIDWCVPSIVTQANGLIPGLKRELLLNVLLPIPPRNEQDLIVSTLCGAFDIIKGMEVEHFKLEDDIRKSRERVLELAISGKLVPQDPSEEPAIELLRRINPDFIPSHNLHYEGELPNGWCFSTIGDLFQHNTGKALNGKDQVGEELRYITTSNLYWDRFDLNEVRTMPFTEAEKEKCRATKGDLLVCEGGDIGRAAIWPYDFDVMIQNHIHRLRPREDISIRFYYYIFLLYKQMGLIGGKGIAILGLSSRELDKMVVPVPPVPEQHRIVTVIENLFAQMDALISNLS